MEDIIIIGSGPAGMTAGLYAARAGLKPVVLEGLESGGQLMQTQHVANYPGFVGTVSGPQIIKAMREQAEQAGVRFVMDAVQSVDFRRGGVPAAPEQNSANLLLRTLMGDVLEAKAVIVATGAGVTKTNLPGEAKYWGRGISACLTCDGAFYKDKRVVIVGEGPAAAGAKTYLMRCGATIAAILPPSEIKEFTGDGTHLTGVVRTDGETVATDGLFLVTARTPQTKFLGTALALDATGYVVTDGTKTSVPGVFAAGDCMRPRHKQAVVAAGDGAVAAMEAMSFLSKTNK